MELTKLSSTVTVKKYEELKKGRNTTALANLLKERFSERYIEPFKDNDFKHGFSIMACSCLMIEALYCFQHGRKRIGGPGKKVFEDFFKNSKYLKCLARNGESFYKNIRCGILHQGETYGGWKIRRTGPIFQKNSLTINATRFMKAVESELHDFTDLLKKESFDSKLWKGVIKKFDDICSNCKRA